MKGGIREGEQGWQEVGLFQLFPLSEQQRVALQSDLELRHKNKHTNMIFF